MDAYCKHRWTPHGPETSRCEMCRTIWRDTTKTNEPKIVIAYTEEKWDGADRRKEIIFTSDLSDDLHIE
jgi:hypothetical protein